MESIFVVKQFELGWDVLDLLADTYLQEEYCTDILEIPDDKIYGTEMMEDGQLEIVLTDLEKSEFTEDWYINLNRISA
ncbi:MAG TPA: hypothetical protein VIN02_03330 [Sulfurovum sp.]